ncbi:thioredoxin [Streptomyces sodiiphilus]|uniref:Thioredoxin n=1 Tax=Streptomyces sodiiphilus TaxID=226217 RepID=A0ABN2PSC1_9ACTN
MMVKEVTDESFDRDVLGSDKPVLVDFWASWCAPCRELAPTLDAIAAEHGEKLEIVKLNIEENPATTSRYRVMSIPVMKVFRNGVVVKSIMGAKPKAKLERKLQDFIG